MKGLSKHFAARRPSFNYLKQSKKPVLPGRVLGGFCHLGEMNIPLEKPDAASLAGARKVGVVRVADPSGGPPPHLPH
jgi:hypothetical protein